MERFSLENKIALVTGASRGLGRAIALGYAQAGADLVLISRGENALHQVEKEIRELGRRAFVFPTDLLATEKIPALFQQIVEQVKSVDILVNVAGTVHRQAAVDFPLSEWKKIFELNVTAPFVLSQEFAKHCIAKNKSGKIIYIASLLSERGRESIPAYTASKGAIRQLTQALAVEWAPHKINVNAIGPGYFETELTKPLIEDEKVNRWVLEKTPLHRWGQPDDLVGTAIFLAAPASDFITGQVIYVDGGWLAAI
ncbi:MAG: glucose 1-dehydrogenase [Calditrichaeota bacterium]|nr:glucose 1-dehydrogenase [Calditrichota bacterium]